MTKFTKILLAVATVFPIAYMIFFLVFVFSTIFFLPPDATAADKAFPSLFMLIIPLHFLAMLLTLGLTIFYIVNVFKNERVDKDKKTLWAVVIFMGSVFAMPIYWYLYIWREGQTPAATAPPPPWHNQQLGGAERTQWANQGATSNREHEYRPPPAPPDWRG